MEIGLLIVQDSTAVDVETLVSTVLADEDVAFVCNNSRLLTLQFQIHFHVYLPQLHT